MLDEIQIHPMARVDMTSTGVAPKVDDLARPFWTDNPKSLNLARACHVAVLTRNLANGTGSQSPGQHYPGSTGPWATQNHTSVFLGAKMRIMSWSQVGGVGVSESSRTPQIELAEISLRRLSVYLLDASAPYIATSRTHSCKTVKAPPKRNDSILVSEFFAFSESACPTRCYRCSWMVRSRRRVSHSSQIRRLGTDV